LIHFYKRKMYAVADFVNTENYQENDYSK